MTVRPIKPLNLGDLEPRALEQATPEFRLVDPALLLVDDGYQRTLSEKSVSLIRRIVAGWDWARFKPPVVAETDEGLEVIDGQHTAIAAATHPAIALVPVIVVQALSQADRAKAFVGHNRDRLGITPMQIHFAALAAGDEDALTIAQVCERAGVKVLRSPPGGGVFRPRETLAVAAIGALCNRRGAMGARKVLEVLAKADCSPIAASGIKAVDVLMHDEEYCGEVEPEAITTALIALGPQAEQEAKVFAAAHNVPVWKGLVVVLFRRCRRGRRRTA
jgi:hypothetical protein